MPDESDLSPLVQRAREAQPGWHVAGPRVRARVIERFRRALYRHRASVAALVTEETGKPLAESYIADVAMALEGARFLARVAEETLAPVRYRSGVLAAWRKSMTTHHDPYGTVAVVSPWNYPFFFPAMHSMSALVAGNAVLLKPSEHTPRCADALARLLHQAGVPPHVFQVVQGDGHTGAALVASPVDKVFFTGSERTGRAIAEACAPRFVPVSLELGGSDAALVLDDARLDVTASGITWGRFTNAGQTCAAVKRVIADHAVHDELVSRIVASVNALDMTTDVGALITADQRELLQAQLGDAIAQGATVAVRREPQGRPGDGDRTAPLVVLTDVTPAMRVWHEETFGPVLAVVRSTSDDDAVRLANATRYGLSASVWSSDRPRARRVAARIDAGAVVLNDSVIAAGLPEVPHGGVKASGIGRIHGIEGLRECTRTRTVVDERLPWLRQPWWFGYGPRTTMNLDGYLRLTHGRSLLDRLAGIPGTIRMLLTPERPL
ncbi:MAG: aldehyde dehydrogenase family protein [Gemmatimonadota bacterium]